MTYDTAQTESSAMSSFAVTLDSAEGVNLPKLSAKKDLGPHAAGGIIWQAELNGVLKARAKHGNLTYEGLGKAVGRNENERNLGNKISRRNFSAIFFSQWLTAHGIRHSWRGHWSLISP
jgi:hypothetical protein